MASRELGQSVEVMARAALLAPGEIALADGAGKTGVALRVAGEDDQVGPGRVRESRYAATPGRPGCRPSLGRGRQG